MIEFAEILKAERMRCNLTQKQVSESLGIKIKTYQAYESLGKSSRRPEYETLVEIAKLFGVTVDYLFDNENI